MGRLPGPGQLHGDHPDDIAVWRPTTGKWFIRGLGRPVTWGAPEDIPVPGDYGGDRHTDLAVFRGSNNTWYIRTL